jgi:hypothetical protein
MGIVSIARRQDDAERNRTAQDAAGHGEAFATGVGRGEWSGRRKALRREQPAHNRGEKCGSDAVKPGEDCAIQNLWSLH